MAAPLLPGLSFLPSDTVLVDRYLLPKIAGTSLDDLGCKAFMHDVDVYSLPPDELTAKYEHAPTGTDGAKVWYFFCPITKPKNAGKGTIRRSRTIGGDIKRWYHSEGSKKEVNGCAAIGGYYQKFTYKEKTASGGNVKPGWLMTEYGVAPEHGGTDMVLCKIYMSPRAPSRKRKAAEEEHVDAPPPTVQRVAQAAVEEEETASCSWGAAPIAEAEQGDTTGNGWDDIDMTELFNGDTEVEPVRANEEDQTETTTHTPPLSSCELAAGDEESNNGWERNDVDMTALFSSIDDDLDLNALFNGEFNDLFFLESSSSMPEPSTAAAIQPAEEQSGQIFFSDAGYSIDDLFDCAAACG
uniref:NAC domain-containing protein n=1 Tax=Leersia perrieri TaxID=77586 RepID=A0A0D9WZF1_9ORYZ